MGRLNAVSVTFFVVLVILGWFTFKETIAESALFHLAPEAVSLAPAYRLDDCPACSKCPVCPPPAPAAEIPAAAEKLVEESLRDLLEYQTGPPKDAGEFSHVYVASLAKRTDRRAYMKLLGRAQELEMTFVDAVFKDGEEMAWIMEQRFLDEKAETIPRNTKLGPNGDLTWQRYYVKHLFEPENYPLEPKGLDTSSIANAGFGNQPLANQMGCFATHLKMMARMIQNKDELALILEDDVDFEWSFKDTWREMFVELDKTWAIVYLAYIFSTELPAKANDVYSSGPNHPRLRPSIRPMGTMGYVLSKSGVKEIFEHLTTEPELLRQPIDMALADLIPALGNERALSAVPKIIGHVGGKAFGSDIMGGPAWADTLGDSTRDRLIQGGFEAAGRQD